MKLEMKPTFHLAEQKAATQAAQAPGQKPAAELAAQATAAARGLTLLADVMFLHVRSYLRAGSCAHHDGDHFCHARA